MRGTEERVRWPRCLGWLGWMKEEVLLDSLRHSGGGVDTGCSGVPGAIAAPYARYL